MNRKNSMLAGLCGLLLCAQVHAAAKSTEGSAKLVANAQVSVNSVVIGKDVVDELVQANVSRGLANTPELRRQIVDELVARELFAQEAQRRGLDKTKEGFAELARARKEALAGLLVRDNLNKNPVTQAQARAEYDRQLALLGDVKSLREYLLRQMVLSSRADAEDVIDQLKKGVAFEKLAQEKSAKGGLLDWVLPSRLVPAVSTVVVNLEKGAVTAVPIEVNGTWQVLRVEDTRAYEPPSFEAAKDRVIGELELVRRLELLKKLRESASIVE